MKIIKLNRNKKFFFSFKKSIRIKKKCHVKNNNEMERKK